MSKSSIDNLFSLVALVFSGQASEEQQASLKDWRDSSPESRAMYEDLTNIWEGKYFNEKHTQMVSQNEANEKIWQELFSEKTRKKRGIINPSQLIKIAASLIIFVAIAYVFLYIVKLEPEKKLEVSTIIKQTIPGQKSTITLRDGSIVYLNSGSVIRYKSDFNDSLRIIELDGQAYFEVFRDETRPFVVKCRNLTVQALGTSFDVYGYKDTPIQVSLVSGSVRLSLPNIKVDKEHVLNPGEYSIINNEDEIIEKGKFDPDEVLAWKEGRLIFKDATIDEIIPKLELWYGVNINNYSCIDSKKPYTSTFEKENLENILMIMGGSLDFNHEFQGNNVVLKKRSPM